MGRYFIKFSYIGTYYRGLQKNVIPKSNIPIRDTDSVQGALECAFSTILPKCITWPRITNSSRTDSGVHGLCNTAHIDLENQYSCIYDPESILKHINKYLICCSHNIRLLDFIPVTDNFHARKLAKSRTYIYRLIRPKKQNEHRIPITEVGKALHVRSETFDIERVKNATQLFVGKKDFKTFASVSRSDKPLRYVRNVSVLTIEEGHPFMPYDPLSKNFHYWNVVCSGKGFLYNQVRRMVGSLISLGIGKITERDIKIMLQVPGHHNWIKDIDIVPAHGLYLANVEYCQEEIDEYSIKYKTSPNNKLEILTKQAIEM